MRWNFRQAPRPRNQCSIYGLKKCVLHGEQRIFSWFHFCWSISNLIIVALSPVIITLTHRTLIIQLLPMPNNSMGKADTNYLVSTSFSGVTLNFSLFLRVTDAKFSSRRMTKHYSNSSASWWTKHGVDNEYFFLLALESAWIYF